MTALREPAAAGHFYPADARELARLVDRLLDGAAEPALAPGKLRALVAPHAGYVYSGTVAASAFAAITPGVTDLRVVLLGPSHFVPLAGAAVTTAEGWETPLGPVQVDEGLRTAALAAGAAPDDGPLDLDHALEVELPFLQRRAGPGLRALPVAVGDAWVGAAVIAAVSADALVLVSTDLSHFHPEAAARRLDRATADAVMRLDAEALDEGSACGLPALQGLLLHARAAGWTAALLDLGTSADCGGDPTQVVGYGAFGLTAS